jgi:hypothetical protein
LSNNNSLLSFGLMNWDKKFLLKCSSYCQEAKRTTILCLWNIYACKIMNKARLNFVNRPRKAHKKIFWYPKMEVIIWHFETQNFFFFFFSCFEFVVDEVVGVVLYVGWISVLFYWHWWCNFCWCNCSCRFWYGTMYKKSYSLQ